MDCPKCGSGVREHERLCSSCQHDCRCPNVRTAEKPEEVRALERRLKDAENVADAQGYRAVLEDFRKAVRGSQAVFCRDISLVMKLVSSDSELYVSFYDQVSSGARRPEQTPMEAQRKHAEEFVFPNYRERICFAALALDGRGVTRFGKCSVELRQAHIQERSTVFEENVVLFCERHDLGMKRLKVPLGYRAVWHQRDELAAAKLGARLTAQTAPQEFPEILSKGGADAATDRFVEVHIYGPIHRTNIARLSLAPPKRKADQALLRKMVSTLKAAGVIIEVKQ